MQSSRIFYVSNHLPSSRIQFCRSQDSHARRRWRCCCNLGKSAIWPPLVPARAQLLRFLPAANALTDAFGSLLSEQACSCSFTYNSGLTPKIGSVSLSGGILNIVGLGFSTTAEDNVVHLGSSDFGVNTASATEISADVSDAPAGVHVVKVYVAGKGLTTSTTGSDLTISVDLSLDAVSPSAGSVAGGTVMTLTGSGFNKIAPGNNKIEVCGSSCVVSSSTSTSIECVVPVLLNEFSAATLGDYARICSDMFSCLASAVLC